MCFDLDSRPPIAPIAGIGFCFGGRLSYLAATLGLGLTGVIGFYGVLVGEHDNGSPAPIDVVRQIDGKVLGLFGGDDPSIAAADVDRFDRGLSAAGVEHRLVTYQGAPHSFFDRKAAEHAEAPAAAWDEVLRFIRASRGGDQSGGG